MLEIASGYTVSLGEVLHSEGSSIDEDDGRLNVKAAGLKFVFPRTFVTASAHVITAVIGSGVLSLAWVNAQLGWIGGPAAIFFFSIMTYLSASILLSACYRSDAGNFQRQCCTFAEASQKNLGDGPEVKIFGLFHYLKIIGSAIGYTIVASTSMMAIQRFTCLHKSQGRNPCQINSYPYMVAFGLVQIILSQVGDSKWFFIIAIVTSFTYSTIGLGLGFTKVVKRMFGERMTGISIGHVIETQKKWGSFRALGDIALAFSFSINLNEIREIIFNSPPSDPKNIITEKAIKFSFAFTIFFHILCGCLGHAAFGESTPRNLLAGFGFYNPYWLLDIANVAVSLSYVVVHQILSRAHFTLIEEQRFAGEAIPNPSCRPHRFNLYRSVCRTVFVMIITLISMFLRSMEDVARLTEILGFWPLTVYLPLRVYIAKLKIKRWSAKWLFLQILSLASLIINIAAVVGYIAGVVLDYETGKPFKEKLG